MATTSICFARAPVNLFEDSAIAFCKKMGYSERQVIMKKRIKPLKEATAEASNSSPNGCDECGLSFLVGRILSQEETGNFCKGL